MPTKAPPQSPQLARKDAIVAEIRAKLEEADAALLTEYRGLTVTQLASLRGALRSAGTEYKVFKNTLARRAAQEAGREDLLPMLEGPTAIAFVRGDAVLAAKALAQHARDLPTLVLKGGLLAGRLISPGEVDALSKVPPREELLARLAGVFQAPLARTAGALAGLQRKTAYAVKALIDQRVDAGEAPPEATGEDAAPQPSGDASGAHETNTNDAPAAEAPAPAAE
jgi:large subunit ribosomal protein L10